MTHPLTKQRRLHIARYREAALVFGEKLVGSISSFLYRLGLLKSDQKSYYVLNTKPLVIYLGNVMRHTFEIAELFKNRRVVFIKNFYHSFENQQRLADLKKEVTGFWHYYPNHRLEFICATKTEMELFKAQGLEPCHHINKNAFVDERQYTIIEGTPKRYDAIHNGQLAIYKRHELAANIKSLALITYRHSSIGRTPENDAYCERIKKTLSHATWLNDVGLFIPPREISLYLSQARVGLALSAEEGPMAACIEYMLSGLPVVSTQSVGGREEFLDPEYSIIVEPSVEAVSNAVRELINRNIDPQFVRQNTLAKLKIHRNRFFNLMNHILEQEGGIGEFENRFSALFVNKLRASAPFPGALLKHANEGMPVALCREFAALRNA